MPTLLINFEWEVDRAGYEFSAASNSIVRRNGRVESIWPLNFHSTLYLQFAQLSHDPHYLPSPQQFTEFMGNFGPITERGHSVGENFLDLAMRVLYMRRLIEVEQTNPRELLGFDTRSTERRETEMEIWKEALEKIPLTEGHLELPTRPEDGWSEPVNAAAAVRAILRPGPPDGRPVLSLVPNSLWDAMLLQFHQNISGGGQLKACAWCGGWFEVGGPAGKRTDARFCSDECRVHSHLSKKKGTKK
jgi:hypothetical protein